MEKKYPVLAAAGEILLQALFPRVCPVCGKLLPLSAKWYRSLQPEKTRSLMICENCMQKLPFVPEPRCIRCSRPLDLEEEILCDICRKKPSSFDSGSALFLHDETARKIIYDLKFHNLRENARFLGHEMAIRFHKQILLWNPEVCIPVPLHKKRFRERGFNQALLIAESLSYWLEKYYRIRLPVDSGYLLRTGNTRPQRTLEAAMREGNVKTAFTVFPREGSERIYRSVLLIDDIFTSGSTINACAGTLKEAGSREVFFLTASIV